MKNQKPLISLIAIAIMGLLISTAASTSVKITNSEDEPITAEYALAAQKSQPLTDYIKEPSIKSLTLDSFPITGGDFDEYHPSVAGSPEGGFFAMTEYTEDGSIWHPLLLGSEDGEIWEPLAEYLYDDAEYTDMDQNAYGTYGTFGAPPDESGQAIVVVGETGDGFVWEWSGQGFDFFSHNRIGCYTYEGPEGDPGEWNWGGLAFTGDNAYTGETVEGCPFILYQVDAESGIIGWLNNIDGCEHVGADMDTVRNRFYSAYDYYDSDADSYQIIVRVDDFGDWIWSDNGYWTHDFLKTLRIKDDLDLKYPSVAAHDHNVIVTCQKGDDVTVYYSTNGMGYKKEVLVEEDASYPEVEFTGGGFFAVLTYNQYDSLWMRTSEDGGATWSEPEEIADAEIASNDRAVQLDQYGGHVFGVWEDERGDNIDIYFDMFFELTNNDPSAPSINGPTQGDAGQVLTFSFKATDSDGDDIQYIVQWGDGTSETTDFYASGEQIALQHTWSSPGDYIVTAKAQDIKGGISPEATSNIKIPRNRAVVFGFFDLFPNFYRFLQILFG